MLEGDGLDKMHILSKKNKVKTVCPGNSTRSDAGSGYKTLSDIIDGYLACGELPVGVNTEGRDEGDGIEATFKRNQACWHMSGGRTLLQACILECLKRQATMLPDNIVLELDPDIQSPTNKLHDRQLYR